MIKKEGTKPPTQLLLWDIDGTVVHTGKAGEVAMGRALSTVFGKTGSIHDIDYPGRTDRMICRMLLEHHGIEPTHQAVHDFVEGYLHALKEELPLRQGTVLPGIHELLTACRDHPSRINALLTGNMVRGAELKLGHYGVWEFFEFGAFADDADERDALGPVALDRAAELLGVPIDPRQVFIIGDTPRDIQCGRAIGAHTISVATGAYSLEELDAHDPDHLFPDFRDTWAFLDILEP